MAEQITTTTVLLQFLFSGITIGCIYAMIAIGFNIIYNVTEVINFAQGEFVMLGGLCMVFFSVIVELPWLIGFLLTLVVVTAIGLLLDRVAIRSIKNPNVLTLIIATIAASMILKGGSLAIWGKDPYDLPSFSGREPIQILNAIIQPQALWVIAFLIIIVAALHFLFEKTLMGKAMQACADNPESAKLMGIQVNRMILLSFALSASIGALAGMVITPISFMEYDRGAMLAVKGFGAVILGGLGSFPGAILGGLIIGLIESFGAGLISSGYKDAFALIVLLFILFFKPNGILGNINLAKFKKF